MSLSSEQLKEWDTTWCDILDNCIEDSSCLSYSGAIKNYLAWCDRKGTPATAPESYCSWIWARARYSSPGSYSKNTVELWRSAISHHFKSSSINTTQSGIAAVTMQAVKKFCREPSQKQELKKSDLKRIIDELRLRVLSSDGTKRKFVPLRMKVKNPIDDDRHPDDEDGSYPCSISIWIDFGTGTTREKNLDIMSKGLTEMFYNQHLCDVHFDFKDSQTVGAHVVILSAGSPVFSAMFRSEFLESQTKKVNIIDIEIEVFRQLLIYLYTGSSPKLAEENMTQLLFVAA